MPDEEPVPHKVLFAPPYNDQGGVELDLQLTPTDAENWYGDAAVPEEPEPPA